MEKFSEITEENIKVLVDSFYGKVGKDNDLGPVFNRVIHDWPSHLGRMYDFWSSIMLQTGKYKGNPLIKHQQIMPFEKGLFNRWLALFSETANEVYEPAQAMRFIAKSENIAESLQYMLFEYAQRAKALTKAAPGQIQSPHPPNKPA